MDVTDAARDTPLDSGLAPTLELLRRVVIARAKSDSSETADPPMPTNPSPAALRLLRLLQRRPPKLTVRNEWIERPDGTRLRVAVHDPATAGARPVILHAHGGGFRIGSPEDGAGHLDQLAHGASAVVVSIDYRLIPEHPYPAALDDVCLTMQWATEQADRLRVDPSRIALAGGSAGGNLALAGALARPKAVAPLRFLLLEEPWLDLSDHPPQPRATHGFYEPFIADLQRCGDLYRGGRSDDDPGVSPGLAPDLSGLPPTTLLVGDLDLLVSQHRRFIQRLREQGVQASMYVFPGLVHGTHGMTRIHGARDYETVAIAALRSAFWL